MGTLWVLSGVFNSDRATTAEKLKCSIRLRDVPAVVVSLDSTFCNLSEDYGFYDIEEKTILKNAAINLVKAKIAQCARDELLNTVVEGEFTEEWIPFFESMRAKYNLRVVIVNFSGSTFKDAWSGFSVDPYKVYDCSVARSYTSGRVSDLTGHEKSKYAYKKLFERGAYGRLTGDEVYSYDEFMKRFSENADSLLRVSRDSGVDPLG